MKFNVNKNKIFETVRVCNSITDNLNSSPNFLGTLIETNNSKLKFTSSNGLISIKSIIEKDENLNIINNGKVLLKTKTLFNVLSKLKKSMINFERIDNSVLKIKTDYFDSNINILDEEKYPNINFNFNGWKEIELPSIVFKKTITKIKHAANLNKEKINIMSGVCFISNKENKTLEVVATDSYKLAFYKFESSLDDFKFVIGIDLIDLFADILEHDKNVKIYISDNNVIFKIKEFLIASKTIDGEFPNISRILTLPKTKKAIISKKTLLDALERGMVFSPMDKKAAAKLIFNSEKIEISFNSVELGNSKEEIPCKSNVENSIEILLNATFLISLLKVFDNDEICIEFEDGLRPVTLIDEKEKNFMQILIPIRN
ncbi:MAG: DNA polymerase III subunit beta [Malacoplasma sp.]|nr:DNA polymerase III subunit beta [Malacoplasma sp.]